MKRFNHNNGLNFSLTNEYNEAVFLLQLVRTLDVAKCGGLLLLPVYLAGESTESWCWDSVYYSALLYKNNICLNTF